MLKSARKKLTDAKFIYDGELSIGGSTWRAPDGQMIDVIEGHEAWWSNALNEAHSNRDAQGLPILPLRYLVLMKFQSGRVQDIADVTRMLGQADEQVTRHHTRAVQTICSQRFIRPRKSHYFGQAGEMTNNNKQATDT